MTTPQAPVRTAAEQLAFLADKPRRPAPEELRPVPPARSVPEQVAILAPDPSTPDLLAARRAVIEARMLR